jgi:hypothetical protein
VRVRAEGGHVVLRTPFSEDAQLLPIFDSTFVRVDNMTRYTFTKTAIGVDLAIDPPDPWSVCKRVPEWRPRTWVDHVA